MLYYGDTSALAKYYLQEEGSVCLSELLTDAEYVVSSALTRLELISALENAKRMTRIPSPAYRQLFATLEWDLRHETISILDISLPILDTAVRLIRRRRLRPADAIQLASAISAGKNVPQDRFAFLCADRLLLEAARLEGLRCIDPTR